MDLGEDWSNNEIIQAAAIGEFTSLDGIEWRNGAETASDESYVYMTCLLYTSDSGESAERC